MRLSAPRWVWVAAAWPLVWMAAPARAGGEAVAIQPGQPQLFVDDFLLESQSGLKRTLHGPVKDNGGREPVIASRPGETLLAYGTIVYDPKIKRYVMFAKNWPPFQMYRLTSADGLDWGPPESWYAEPIPIGLTDPVSGRKATGTDCGSPTGVMIWKGRITCARRTDASGSESGRW